MDSSQRRRDRSRTVSHSGEPIDFVKDHLGHRNIESSLVYARVSDRRRSEAISWLERSREIALPA